MNEENIQLHDIKCYIREDRKRIKLNKNTVQNICTKSDKTFSFIKFGVTFHN